MSEIVPLEERLKVLRRFYQNSADKEWCKKWHRPSEMYVGNGYLGFAHCSFATARRDMDRLVKEGLLERRMEGRGWFVYYEYRLKSE